MSETDYNTRPTKKAEIILAAITRPTSKTEAGRG
jgi:hypothetical protein